MSPFAEHRESSVGFSLRQVLHCSDRFVLFTREGNSPDHHLTVTYRQLLSQVCRCANVLKQMGEKLSITCKLYNPNMSCHVAKTRGASILRHWLQQSLSSLSKHRIIIKIPSSRLHLQYTGLTSRSIILKHCEIAKTNVTDFAHPHLVETHLVWPFAQRAQ